jgi:hypothetical protein
MKGLFLIYGFLLFTLPTTNMNCSNVGEPNKKEPKDILANEQSDNTILKNQKGVVHIYVCSRGCYQYVLETTVNNKLIKISPDAMDELCKKDNLSVIFSGKLTTEMIDIKKPSANDVPVLDFKAVKILIESIKADN